MDKIGILGGSFDPIHLGHTQIAQEVLDYFNLEKILFMPCGTPPHRDKLIASPAHRKNMVNLAIENNTNFILEACELDRPGLSYMINSLGFLKNKFKNKKLFLIIGMDGYLTFTAWHEWQKILDLCELIVVARPGFDKPNLIHPNTHFYLTPNPNPISATQIRNLIKHNQTPDGLDKRVYAYIQSEKLYV